MSESKEFKYKDELLKISKKQEFNEICEIKKILEKDWKYFEKVANLFCEIKEGLVIRNGKSIIELFDYNPDHLGRLANTCLYIYKGKIRIVDSAGYYLTKDETTTLRKEGKLNDTNIMSAFEGSLYFVTKEQFLQLF